jgi:hypothetical protein
MELPYLNHGVLSPSLLHAHQTHPTNSANATRNIPKVSINGDSNGAPKAKRQLLSEKIARPGLT